jgi:hypothetical protein
MWAQSASKGKALPLRRPAGVACHRGVRRPRQRAILAGRQCQSTKRERAMYGPIILPFGAKMLFNSVKLKPGISFDDVEEAVAEMCNVVKETYGGEKGGFIAGQVFRFSGFVSDEGSLGDSRGADEHYAIVTYWRSFTEHERSHADKTFTDKFGALAAMCSETKELGYDMLWQGEPEG